MTKDGLAKRKIVAKAQISAIFDKQRCKSVEPPRAMVDRPNDIVAPLKDCLQVDYVQTNTLAGVRH